MGREHEKLIWMALKLENGILLEEIGREYQGHFLVLILVSNGGLFVLILRF